MASSIGGKSGSGGGSGKENVPPEKMSAYERWVLPNMEVEQVREEFAISSAMRRKGAVTQSTASAPEETVAPLTAEDVEAIRQAAFEEGYSEGKDTGYREGKEEGHKKGYDEGYKSGQDDVRSIALRMSQICRVLLEPIPANDDALEAALKQLVTQMCTQVVRRELMIDSTGIAIVVREALECLQPGNKRIRIHLNPDDIDVVERELRDINQWEGQWRLLAHRTITPGGCIIDTDDSIVDARAEKRLSALVQQVYSKDPTALVQEAAPRDSLAQVLNEVQSFAGEEFEESTSTAETNKVTDTALEEDPASEPSVKTEKKLLVKQEAIAGESTQQNRTKDGDAGAFGDTVSTDP